MSLLHRRHRDFRDSIEPKYLFTAASEQVSQQQANSRVPRRRSSGLKFFASSATPKPEISKGSHDAWEADYLKDLRTNPLARPGGSRPLPEHATTFIPEPYTRASSAMSFRLSASARLVESSPNPIQERSASALSHRQAHSYMPGSIDGNGRSMVRQPDLGLASREFSASTMATTAPSITPSGTYRESGMRWMEKQEARSLREALEDMDLRDEAKVHADAQDEASNLVWKHRNEGVPYRNPNLPYNYKQHLEKGAHARSQSIGWYTGPSATNNHYIPGQRSVSDHSASSKSEKNTSLDCPVTDTLADPTKTSNRAQIGGEQGHALWDSPQKKAYMSLTSPKLPSKVSGRRRSSGPRARDASAGLFRNPDDKIYEEPEESRKPFLPVEPEQTKIPAPLTSKSRNAASKMLSSGELFLHSRVASAEDKQRVYRSEIHRNPPSQSRNPSYLRNGRISTPSDLIQSSGASDHPEEPQMKDGKEIRSDDIRAATSMRRQDRSPKLPSPTVVSHRPGRPIVSFEQDWKPKIADKEGSSQPSRPSGVPARLHFKPQMPESTASAPVVPTINVPDPPLIQVNDVPSNESPSIPSISVSTPIPAISLPDDSPATRPLPSPSNGARPSPANRPLPHHSSTTPVHSSKLHWSPSSRRATAQCAACALPIEGRIVSAASQRFHPHCFTCHHCAEALECVAFYPEPDSTRSSRLARIEARANGTLIPEEQDKPGETALDDGDPSLRFYCHLDFHELFSPRCRSCKTPIESEVVLACGASWHVGHFFCAQCGDPFDAKMPFVEKDGYAWCVGCHVGRFSGKCKGCRKPVVDGGVMALGGEWHVDCFCCVECGEQFEDGRFFTKGEEERPVCVGCEERRLKA